MPRVVARAVGVSRLRAEVIYHRSVLTNYPYAHELLHVARRGAKREGAGRGGGRGVSEANPRTPPMRVITARDELLLARHARVQRALASVRSLLRFISFVRCTEGVPYETYCSAARCYLFLRPFYLLFTILYLLSAEAKRRRTARVTRYVRYACISSPT